MEKKDLKIGQLINIHLIKIDEKGQANLFEIKSKVMGFSHDSEYGDLVIIEKGFHFPISWIEKTMVSKITSVTSAPLR